MRVPHAAGSCSRERVPQAGRTACGAAIDAADERAERILDRLRDLVLGLLLVADQREQRIVLTRRVEVEDQPVLVRRDRREREELRRGCLLQVDHHPHRARLVLADPQAGDVGIVGADLADQLAQCGTQFEAVDVDHQARRILGQEVAHRERRVGLDRHAGVVARRPTSPTSMSGTPTPTW